MTLVERMARAMAEDAKDYTFERTGQLSQHFRTQALAALRAARDAATPAMYAAAFREYVPANDAAACWHAMVDAALSEAERHVNEEGR